MPRNQTMLCYAVKYHTMPCYAMKCHTMSKDMLRDTQQTTSSRNSSKLRHTKMSIYSLDRHPSQA